MHTPGGCGGGGCGGAGFGDGGSGGAGFGDGGCGGAGCGAGGSGGAGCGAGGSGGAGCGAGGSGGAGCGGAGSGGGAVLTVPPPVVQEPRASSVPTMNNNIRAGSKARSLVRSATPTVIRTNNSRNGPEAASGSNVARAAEQQAFWRRGVVERPGMSG